MTRRSLERGKAMVRALTVLMLLCIGYLMAFGDDCRPPSDAFSSSLDADNFVLASLQSQTTTQEISSLAQDLTERSSPQQPTDSLSSSSAISRSNNDPKEAAFQLAFQRYLIRQLEQEASDAAIGVAFKDLFEMTRSSHDNTTRLLNLIRIPKAGSSSLSMVARALVGCQPDGYACCAYPGTPPGSCPLPGLLCPRVKGCTGHNPNYTYKDSDDIMATIISLREPVQRMISGWFYGGIHRPKPDSDHSWDMFQNEYAGTTKYSNVMVKMLIAQGPYYEMDIDERHVKEAKDRLCKITWFALDDQFELPAALLLYETGVFRQIQPKPLIFGLPTNYTISSSSSKEDDAMTVTEGQEQQQRRRQLENHASSTGERVNENEEYAQWKAKYLANAKELMKRTNAPDLELYDFALKLLAARMKENPELVSVAKAANEVISDEIDELLTQHWNGTVEQLCSNNS